MTDFTWPVKTLQACPVYKGSQSEAEYNYMKGIVRDQRGHLYAAKWTTHTHKLEEASAVLEVTPLEGTQCTPMIRRGWKIVPSGIEDEGLFVKRPSVEDYKDPNLCLRMFHEITTNEFLRHNPHPNIATYHGCEISPNGEVDALYFTKYLSSLFDLCNPEHLHKRAFVRQSSDRANPMFGRYHVHLNHEHINELVDALLHLHSLGLVHNDIKPQNIVFGGSEGDELDEYGRPTLSDVKLYLIDFDSTRPIGTSLISSRARMTTGWNGRVPTATPEEDLKAMEEVRTWLFGSLEEFQW